MFHNVLMTSLTPYRDTSEHQGWGHSSFTTIWPEAKQKKIKDTNIKKTIKKRKRNRTMFTTEQVKMLEKVFNQSKYIDIEKRKEISERLQIEQKCIKIWFQNRRMKEKKELSESCDSSNEDALETSSPPLELSQPPNKMQNNGPLSNDIYGHTRPPYCYYNVSDNYIKPETSQNEENRYEMANSASQTQFLNYNFDYNNHNGFNRNNTDYSAQYYLPQIDFQNYYNTNLTNQNTPSDVQDWPVNIFDTSYL